jgi:hypothetical protein
MGKDLEAGGQTNTAPYFTYLVQQRTAQRKMLRPVRPLHSSADRVSESHSLI